MPLKVALISHTPDPQKTIACAAKLCYSSSTIDGLMDSLDDDGANRFVNMLSEIGHASPTEHISFTFGIEGVSRALLAQLTRHRIASYSVQSQRYVKEGHFEYVIPPEIEGIKEAKEEFLKAMDEDQMHYERITKILFEKHFNTYIENGLDEMTAKRNAEKQAIEDARFVLPNACETKLIMTMNARSLINFFEHRCCNRAQWEIRALADEMLLLVKDVSKELFKKAGPPCVSSSCTEGKFSCGKIKEMRKKYN
jgi:thymidylate synthase (FAD)